ncbi:MAG TPA: hypothetical protein VFQ44_28830 [Streptosporangiaceae bacterium]|nr:hypothetical protein [Streptosporangiaceae bacterium]
MALAQSGHVERLPSGSLRVSVFAGKDPLTGKQLWHRKTVRTEREAQIALGKLLEEAEAGRRPATRVTVAEAIARYMEVTRLDLSTRRTYEGYISRTILPGSTRGCVAAATCHVTGGRLLSTPSSRPWR